MKTKLLFFALTYFSAIFIGLAQDAQTPLDEKGICDLLRKELSPLQGFPNAPIDVLFFDINHDGIPDALVSYRFDTDAGGCHGNGWSLFRFENGEWNQSPFKETDDDNWKSYNSVFARGDDFYSLTEDGQKPKLFLVYSYYDRNSLKEGTEVSQDGYEITIDNEGYLKSIPIPALTTNYFPRYDEENDAFLMETTEMQDKLVPLSIESFYPQKKNEDGKSPPVATAEQEGVAQVSPSNREEKLGIRNEELGIEKQEAPSRLWLYVGVIFFLSAVFYALRRKFFRN